MKMLLITDSSDALIGMRLAGVETVRVKNPTSAAAEIKKVYTNPEIGIVFITASIEKMCKDDIFRLKQAGRPLVAVISDSDGSGQSANAVAEYIADAIGIKI